MALTVQATKERALAVIDDLGGCQLLPQVMAPPREIAEKDVLERFWKLVGGQPRSTIVGFNILNFDLPVLFVRSEFCSGRAA